MKISPEIILNIKETIKENLDTVFDNDLFGYHIKSSTTKARKAKWAKSI